MYRPITHSLLGAVLAAAALIAPAAQATDLAGDATDAAVVSALNLPAWVERGGKLIPLRPGMHLVQGDAIVTGAHGRVHLDTPDGSIVKLGSSGRMQLDQLAMRQDSDGGLFQGALRVLEGAFRFTTRLAAKARHRDVRVTVGVVTAGIRGTDIWGKSDDEKDLVCLLEGHIGVSSVGQPEQRMDDANTFYVVPKHQAPNPIAPVDPAKIANQWAPQTELDPGQAALSPDGAWTVVLSSQSRRADAEAGVAPLAALGYPAEVAEAQVFGRTWYRLLVHGFASRADAQRFANQMEGVAGTAGAWITRD